MFCCVVTEDNVENCHFDMLGSRRLASYPDLEVFFVQRIARGHMARNAKDGWNVKGGRYEHSVFDSWRCIACLKAGRMYALIHFIIIEFIHWWKVLGRGTST